MLPHCSNLWWDVVVVMAMVVVVMMVVIMAMVVVVIMAVVMLVVINGDDDRNNDTVMSFKSKTFPFPLPSNSPTRPPLRVPLPPLRVAFFGADGD